jgi:hypothetical protein
MTKGLYDQSYHSKQVAYDAIVETLEESTPFVTAKRTSYE